MSIQESDLEISCLRWFAELGYEVLASADLDPAAEHGERESVDEVVLQGRLRGALGKLNPELTAELLDEALRRIQRRDWPTLEQNNLAFHRLLASGLELEAAAEQGGVRGVQVQLFDFADPTNNDWVVASQFEVVDRVTGTGQKRRLDVVVWVNGLPLAAIELKNPASASADVWDAYNQLQTYKRDIPSLFSTNELLVVSDDVLTRVGSLTAQRSRFQPWRAIQHEQDILPSEKETLFENGERLEALLRGVFAKERFLDLVRNFVTFETVDGKPAKIVAAYHQFHAVQTAVAETRKALVEGSRKVGVVWHTQGSGKSLTMLFYVRKLVLDPALDNPTVVIITDRNDLDDQLFGTFARAQELLRQEPVQATDRKHLRELLRTASGGVYFTTIQKFLPAEGEPQPALSDRHNIVVIADEAHRSQYGFRARVDRETAKVTYGLAKHLRDALPQAAFIGFTGTPIEQEDKSTVEVFGSCISVYDIRRAVEDQATVPIYYESRLAKLDLDEAERPKIDPKFAEVTEGEEDSVKERLKSEWSSIEALVGTDKRINQIAADLVTHFAQRETALNGGKAMIVCMSRRICVAMYEAISKLRPEWAAGEDEDGALKVVMTGSAADPPSWQPHIRAKERLAALAEQFKRADSLPRIVIVRDMWLTGFDAPCLHTLYLDKPMRGHGLMQAIARVNRVFGDKSGGLVVDYLGIAPFLKEAMHTYSQSGGKGSATLDQEAAWELLIEKLEVCHALFHGFPTRDFFRGEASQRLAVLAGAREHILARRAGGETAARKHRKGQLPSDYDRFMKVVTELSKAAGLVAADDRFETVRNEVAFYQAVKAGLVKLSPGKRRPTGDLQHAVRQIVANAVVSDTVIDVFQAAGLPKPDISVLSAEFLAEVAGMEHQNLAAALLERLLRNEIQARRKVSVIQARSFEELLEKAIQRYLNRSVAVTQVIEELLELASALRAAALKAQELGLSREEYAFYEALADNTSAREVLGDQRLSAMAHELTTIVRKNATLDWEKKRSVQAQLRVLVRRLLKKYDYPPDGQARAVETVLEQARTLGINLVEGAPGQGEPSDERELPEEVESAPPRELPYPLAVFAQIVISQESRPLRIKSMLDAIERAIVFLAVCTLARLRELNGGTFSPEVLALIGQTPGKPLTMGTWNSYAVEAAKLLPADAQDPVSRAARALVAPDGQLSELAKELAQRIIPYRNTFAHGVTEDEAQLLEHEAPIHQAWQKLLKGLAPLRETELVTVAAVGLGVGEEFCYRLRLHQGAQERFPITERTMTLRLREHWSYLLRPGQPPLSLAPFVACAFVKEKERQEVLFAKGIVLNSGDKTELAGVASQSKLKLSV